MAKAGEKHPDSKHSAHDPKPTAPAPGAEPAVLHAANDPIEGMKIADKPTAIVLTAPPTIEPPPGLPPTPTPERYVVIEKTTVSMDGQFITLNPDDIISAASYGPRGFQRIKDSNVKMRRIEDLPKAEPVKAKAKDEKFEEL
jgi:hypothetical protein